MERGQLLRKALVSLLVVLFGTGSWVAINGIWVELPLLVSLNIPEGYGLASYIIVITQFANVGPLIFTIANYFTSKDTKLEVPTVYLITTIGWITCILMVFFWDNYTVWAGELHSTAFLILCLLLAVVDCTSSVAFTPFMARFKSVYLTWYFVGEGMSSLLPGLVALIQGVGGDGVCRSNYTYTNVSGGVSYRCNDWVSESKPARFGPEEFFFFLFVMMFLSFFGFLLLNILPVAKKEHAQDAPSQSSVDTVSSGASTESHNMLVTNMKGEEAKEGSVEPAVDLSTPQQIRGRPLRDFVFLFTVLGVVNALSNGILPSIQSYSAGAYSLTTYLYAATLGNISNPIACFAVMLLPLESLVVVGVAAGGGMLAGVYCLYTAANSLSPPLQDETMGSVLVVFAWICVVAFFSYTKATVGWILRQEPNKRTLLIWFGAITQLGSLTGALIMFPIVTFTQAFQAPYHDPCEGRPTCVPIVTPTENGAVGYLVA